MKTLNIIATVVGSLAVTRMLYIMLEFGMFFIFYDGLTVLLSAVSLGLPVASYISSRKSESSKSDNNMID